MRHAREANRLDHKIRNNRRSRKPDASAFSGRASRGGRPAPRAGWRSALERIVAIASSRERPATSVSHTNASIPNVAPMPWTSRRELVVRHLPAQRRERVLDPADPHPPVHRQVGRAGAIRLEREAQDRALLGLVLQDPVGVVPPAAGRGARAGRPARRRRAAAAPRCAGRWRPAGRAWSGSSGRPSSARSPPRQRRPPSSAARRCASSSRAAAISASARPGLLVDPAGLLIWYRQSHNGTYCPPRRSARCAATEEQAP